MKKVVNITVILMLFISCGILEAQVFRSDLKLNLQDGRYLVKFAGMDYHISGDLEIMNLKRGDYSLEIFKKKTKRSNGARSKGIQLVYSGRIQVPQSSTVYVDLNRFNRTKIRIHRKHNKGITYNDPYRQNREYVNSTEVRRLKRLNKYDFRELLTELRECDNDRLKMELCEYYYTAYSLKSNQIRKMAKCFEFDSHRKRFVKRAYRNCLDKENYNMVYSSFKYRTNIKEIEVYLCARH